MRRFFLLSIFVLAACAAPVAPEPTATATPPPTRVPTSTPTTAQSAPTTTGYFPELPRGRTAEGYQYLGNPDAPVTIMVYSDFLCTSCAIHTLDVEPRLIEEFVVPGQAKIVYRHLLQLGERSELLAEASECAADHGKFWELRRELYARYNQLYFNTRETVIDLAAGLGIPRDAFTACLDAHTYRAQVQADYAAAMAEGVYARPVFRIGNETMVGSQRLEAFAQVIERAAQR
ncbi:disulfide bond formation protein DsbA [Chloroflexus islandicus]|uniref:Disulfide bond formation protein DsbA n=1 Tax=Chloroflexus islandicus TaxID=1707952 RepID=A0A178MC32_9CHLR|nr:Rcas_1661 family thioredoxin-like (seleno)lipoprotein [Chloroflexus islandicus]OAN46319.1 disulfide bond formation protein DsbA [Chloroflexus islandicus]